MLSSAMHQLRFSHVAWFQLHNPSNIYLRHRRLFCNMHHSLHISDICGFTSPSPTRSTSTGLCILASKKQPTVQSTKNIVPNVPKHIGSISAALPCLVYPPRGRSAGSFPEKRLVIEPTCQFKGHETAPYALTFLSFVLGTKYRRFQL